MPTFDKELELFGQGYDYVVGIDEVGRGPWAGPVVSCAVVLAPGAKLVELVRDSKKLSSKQRGEVHRDLMQTVVAFGVGEVSNEQIDEIGLTEATQTSMRKAFSEAVKEIDVLSKKLISLVDGYFPTKTCNEADEQYIVNGDEVHYSIAAASVIAKVYRDNLMIGFDKAYPEFGFGAHKGYGTLMHREALGKFGITPIHRKSFKPVKKYCVDDETTTGQDWREDS